MIMDIFIFSLFLFLFTLIQISSFFVNSYKVSWLLFINSGLSLILAVVLLTEGIDITYVPLTAVCTYCTINYMNIYTGMLGSLFLALSMVFIASGIDSYNNRGE